MQITQSRNAKTLTPSHMKQCILSESRFDFLKDLVKNIPDASVQEDIENNANEPPEFPPGKSTGECEPKNATIHIRQLSTPRQNSTNVTRVSNKPQEIVANFYTEQSTSSARTPVIQYTSKVSNVELKQALEPKLHVDLSVSNMNATTLPLPDLVPTNKLSPSPIASTPPRIAPVENVPPLVPNSNIFPTNTSDNLYIDEDYDN